MSKVKAIMEAVTAVAYHNDGFLVKITLVDLERILTEQLGECDKVYLNHVTAEVLINGLRYVKFGKKTYRRGRVAVEPVVEFIKSITEEGE